MRQLSLDGTCQLLRRRATIYMIRQQTGVCTACFVETTWILRLTSGYNTVSKRSCNTSKTTMPPKFQVLRHSKCPPSHWACLDLYRHQESRPISSISSPSLRRGGATQTQHKQTNNNQKQHTQEHKKDQKHPHN